jgi:hypothetical protein
MVELDGTYIRGKTKPGKWSRSTPSKVPVVVAVESHPMCCGNVALSKMKRLSSHRTKPFLQQKLQQGSHITLDGLHLYRHLTEYFDIEHITLHAGTSAVEIFPDVRRVIARLKTWIPGTHSPVSTKRLNRYLSEFSYRFTRRSQQRRVTIFDRLVRACCATEAVRYCQLVVDLSE